MTGTLLMICGLLALAMLALMIPAHNLRDALLKVTRALPNGATNVTSTPIDTQTSARGNQPGEMEFLLTAPVLTTARLPDTQTMIYDLVSSDASDMSNPVTVQVEVIRQTGAGGAGAAEVQRRFRLPSQTKRYLAIKATKSGAGDASGASLTLELLA